MLSDLVPASLQLCKEAARDSIFSVSLTKQTIDDINASKNSWFYENSGSLIGSLITAAGFVLAVRQLRRSDKILQGDLALKLDDKIGQHRDVYKKMFEGGEYYDLIPEDKIEDVEYYMTFFDTTALLVRNKQIKLRQINQLYGYRFLHLMHHPSVHKIIKKRINSWKGIIWLYDEIIVLRAKSGEKLIRPQHKFKPNEE